jgi:hypothetical protein
VGVLGTAAARARRLAPPCGGHFGIGAFDQVGGAVRGLLLWGLTRRWLGAWIVLLAWNGFAVFAVVAIWPSSGPTWVLPSAPLFVLLGLVSVGLLLSPLMRQYLDIRRRRTPGPRQAAG